MLKEIKCECGHVNPIGTVFCEACGKPFESNENIKPLDMRYEGVLGDLSRKQKRLLIKFGAFSLL